MRSPPFCGCTRAQQRNRARRIADGAEAISDIAVLADQPALFGPVASDSTCWRLHDALDADRLSTIAGARAREVAWAQRAEATGAAFARSRAAGTTGLDALVIDLDAHVLVCHSEKQQAAPTFNCTFGYRPLLAFLDSTGEFLAPNYVPQCRQQHRRRPHRRARRRARSDPRRLPARAPILVRADAAG